MKPLSQTAFAAVTQLFERVSGIRLAQSKQALVAGRLQRLALEAGETDLDAYVDRLVRGHAPAEEMTRLIDRLTTNETYFFREPQHYQHLAQWLAERGDRGGDELRVWSAASSSGEEAYSIAMLLAEKLGQAPWRVIGTDLSSAMVEAARRGLYPMERARKVPQEYLKRYCLRGQGEHEGRMLVGRALRERVHFEQANLMTELSGLPMFDVIFLRNVLIYFDNDAKRAILRRVLAQLKPDGLLYTGHAESISTLGVPVRVLQTAVHAHV